MPARAFRESSAAGSDTSPSALVPAVTDSRTARRTGVRPRRQGIHRCARPGDGSRRYVRPFIARIGAHAKLERPPGCGRPRDSPGAGRSRLVEEGANGLGQHVRQAATTRNQDTILDERRKIQAVSRAGQRDVHETLGLLALAELFLVVRLRHERPDRHVLAGNPDGLGWTAGSPREIDDEHDGELEAFRGVHGHEVDGVEASSTAFDSSPAVSESR